MILNITRLAPEQIEIPDHYAVDRTPRGRIVDLIGKPEVQLAGGVGGDRAAGDGGMNTQSIVETSALSFAVGFGVIFICALAWVAGCNVIQGVRSLWSRRAEHDYEAWKHGAIDTFLVIWWIVVAVVICVAIGMLTLSGIEKWLT